MPKPTQTPIGLVLATTAKTVSRAFDDALSEAGASLPVWLILLAVKNSPGCNQRQIAEGIGIHGATLTHHLNAMEKGGLVRRRRTEMNRREHEVLLTAEGEKLFRDLAAAAHTFDADVRAGLEQDDLVALRGFLERLSVNATTTRPARSTNRTGIEETPE